MAFRIRPGAALALLALGMTIPAVADPGDKARKLSQLRTDVEELSESLALEREALRADLRSREMRKVDVEARIRQAELRLEEVDRELERQREVLEADDVAATVLTPVLVDGLHQLEAEIGTSLPYRTADRRETLEEIRAQLADGTVDPRKVAGRVWSLYEDELRLNRENIMDRQVITLDDGETLAEVVRLGMVALYWRTGDGRGGYVVRDGDRWTYEAVSGQGAAQIEELFESLKKQVRAGWFELPWALVEVTR